MLDLAVLQRLEFGRLDQPSPESISIASLPSVAAEGHFVRKPLLADRKSVNQGRLARTLVAFEDQHLVELASGLAHAANGGDQDDAADSLHEGTVFGAPRMWSAR